MWFKKKRPIVQIFDDCIRDSGDVDVQDYRKEAIENPVKTHYASWASALKEKDPPPDTIESLINRLIELGEPKPEVVITGKKRADGSEEYRANIDGKQLEWDDCRYIHLQRTANRLESIENKVIRMLKCRIAEVVTETTTITY